MVGSQEVGIFSVSFGALLGFVLVETFVYLIIVYPTFYTYNNIICTHVVSCYATKLPTL